MWECRRLGSPRQGASHWKRPGDTKDPVSTAGTGFQGQAGMDPKLCWGSGSTKPQGWAGDQPDSPGQRVATCGARQGTVGVGALALLPLLPHDLTFHVHCREVKGTLFQRCPCYESLSHGTLTVSHLRIVADMPSIVSCLESRSKQWPRRGRKSRGEAGVLLVVLEPRISTRCTCQPSPDMPRDHPPRVPVVTAVRPRQSQDLLLHTTVTL